MGPGYAARRGCSRQLPLRRRLRRRVPRLPLLLQRRRLRGAGHRSRRPLGLLAGDELDDDETADLVELVERDAIASPERARAYLVRHWDALALVRGESLVYWLKKLVFRGAWLDHRVKEGLLEVDWDEDSGGLHATATRTAAARCSSSCRRRAGTSSSTGRDGRAGTRSRRPAYLAALLAVDTQVGSDGQLALGALTWLVLALALRPLAAARARAGARRRPLRDRRRGHRLARLGRLPLPAAQPAAVHPAGPRARLPRAASRSRWARPRARRSSGVAAVGAAAWGIAGLTVLPRLDVAGAIGVPLLLVFLWRSRWRAMYAGVFLVVAALELYGTSIGTWRWADECPGSGSRTATRRAASRAATSGST